MLYCAARCQRVPIHQSIHTCILDNVYGRTYADTHRTCKGTRNNLTVMRSPLSFLSPSSPTPLINKRLKNDKEKRPATREHNQASGPRSVGTIHNPAP